MAYADAVAVAFTLAEVLITLGIIGVIAALLMPMFLSDFNERKYSSARLKALKAIGEAVRIIAVNEGIGNAENAEDFVENYLRKHINIIKTCKNSDLRSCGIATNPNEITSLTEQHTKITMPIKNGDLGIDGNGRITTRTSDPNSKSYGFVMSNGYSVNLFYNPKCLRDNEGASFPAAFDYVCVNAIYDMNGLALPNEVGKDIGFVTVIYPDEQVVAYAPDVHIKAAGLANSNNASAYCQRLGKDLFVPNRDELLAMYYNGYFLKLTSGATYLSSSFSNDNLVWVFWSNFRKLTTMTDTERVRCIRR